MLCLGLHSHFMSWKNPASLSDHLFPPLPLFPQVGGARGALRLARISVRPVLIGLIVNRAIATLEAARAPEARAARMTHAEQVRGQGLVNHEPWACPTGPRHGFHTHHSET